MSLDPTAKRLLRLEAVGAIRRAADDIPWHLVGGCVRDAFLKRCSPDLDVVVEHSGAQVGERLASLTNGKLINLGGDAFTSYRVVSPTGVVDIWDRQRQPLEQDLERRDLTINAMAIDGTTGELIDPFGGHRDLGSQKLCATTNRVFLSDPLRVLRLARLVAQLEGFAVEPRTLQFARQAAPTVPSVAGERLRAELRLLLTYPGARRGVELLRELSVYPDLWTQLKSKPVPAEPLITQLTVLENLLADLDPNPVQPEPLLVRHALLLLGLPALADTPAVLVDLAARRLVSRDEKRRLERLLSLSSTRPLTDNESEQRWFLHRAGEDWPSAALLDGCRRGTSVDRVAWTLQFAQLVALATAHADQIFSPAPLLRGDEVGHLLRLPPGPQLGQVVAGLKRAQVRREVTTRDEASQWLECLDLASLSGPASPSGAD